MKKYTNILVALGVTLFLLTIGIENEVLAEDCECLTVIDTLTVDGCDYEIELCAKCRYAFPGEVSKLHYKNLGPCSTTLNPEQVFQGILSQISNYAYLWFDHCQGPLPPCNENARREITFDIPICWHAKLIFIDPLTLDKTYLYEQCDDVADCKVTYSYCKDAFGAVHKEVVSHNPYETPTCNIEGEFVILPTDLGDSSDCYIIHTPCNE